MILSIAIYAFKIMKDNDYNFYSFILDKVYGNNLISTTEDEQNQMNFLSQPSENPGNTNNNKNSIYTTTGYEGLATISERTCYNLIKSQCDKISNDIYKSKFYVIEDITVPGAKLSTTQIKKIMYAIQNDNPDIFWIASTFSYRYSGNSTVIKLNSVFSKKDQQKAVEALNNKVSEIISSVPKNSSEYNTELFLHDYIVDNCKYEKITVNSESNPKVFTTYGCLVEGSAVCEGFSKSMQLLMNRAGMECKPIAGSRRSESHMWNVVKINDNWYHLDVTWDGAGTLSQYNYFNVTDDIIKKDHTINEELSKTTKFNEDIRYNFKLPICTAAAENYFEKNAIKIKNLNSGADNLIIKKIIESANLKKEFLYIMVDIMVDKNTNFDSVKKQLFIEKPYKYFSYVTAANKSLSNGHKINTRNAHYGECIPQNVIIVQLNYA